MLLQQLNINQCRGVFVTGASSYLVTTKNSKHHKKLFGPLMFRKMNDTLELIKLVKLILLCLLVVASLCPPVLSQSENISHSGEEEMFPLHLITSSETNTSLFGEEDIIPAHIITSRQTSIDDPDNPCHQNPCGNGVCLVRGKEVPRKEDE